MPVAGVLQALGSSPDGLPSAEAEIRLARVGPNAVRTHHASAWRVFLGQVRSPLLLLLLAAAAVSAFVGEGVDAAIIGVIVAASVGLGFVNEYRADRAAEALHSQVRHIVTALRDGAPTGIEITHLVPGDVVQLSIGAVVPADMRILSANGLECDESILTGEAEPVSKDAAIEDADATADPSSRALFMGTVVHRGSARAVVVATGPRTRFGHIAMGLGERQPRTEFQAGLARFSGLLAKVALVLSVAILAINLLLGRPWIDAILFALAVAVGITPQLLPAVVSTSLASGSHRLAARKVLVKRLVCIEDLGDIDVLFSDKTGTLTEGRVSFDRAIDRGGDPSDAVIELGLLCSEAGVTEGDGVSGDPLDQALRAGAGAAPPGTDGASLGVVPFDHDRRCTSVLVDRREGRTLITKGAPESVLARCTGVSEADRRTVDAEFAKGNRVVAVATRPAPDLSTVSADDERDLVLEGYLIFLDPPKRSASASVARLRDLGVAVKIVTGDNPVVATTVCRELAIPVDEVLTGPEIEALDDDALLAAVTGVSIFARVSPEQKARILRAQRTAGSAVAFLGDGVNDALALHHADVGISVDSAVDVAKDAADIILLEHDLDVLADGVVEGRRTFANTIKYVRMGTSSNFGNMFSVTVASAFLPFLPMLPFQILLNNLLYDTSQLAIPTDHVDAEQLLRPSHWDVAEIRRFMLRFGPISSAFDIASFAVLLWVFHATAPAFRAGWFIESIATQTLVVFVIRTLRVPFLRSRPSRTLAVSVFAVVVVGIAIPLSPLASTLGFATPPIGFMALMVPFVAVYLAVVDVAKLFFFREVTPAPRKLRRARPHRIHRIAARWSHHEPLPAVRSSAA
jgi:Mg2+-importing ATPase